MKDIANYEFVKRLKELPFIEEIWVFGSRARQDATERSDIDLAVLCPNAGEKEWVKVLDILSNADTLLKIDCIRFDRLEEDDRLKDNILKYKTVIYKKDNKMDEIFWKDYFATLGTAIERLAEVIRHPDVNKNDFMRDSAIQRFEFVIELFWKVLKKILIYEKLETVTPRDIFAKAYQSKLIDDEKIWLAMLDDRNNTSHGYKQEEAKRIFENIKTYLLIFEGTYGRLKIKYQL